MVLIQMMLIMENLTTLWSSWLLYHLIAGIYDFTSVSFVLPFWFTTSVVCEFYLRQNKLLRTTSLKLVLIKVRICLFTYNTNTHPHTHTPTHPHTYFKVIYSTMWAECVCYANRAGCVIEAQCDNTLWGNSSILEESVSYCVSCVLGGVMFELY